MSVDSMADESHQHWATGWHAGGDRNLFTCYWLHLMIHHTSPV